jgi:V8-like Glu-specific endopeptidase
MVLGLAACSGGGGGNNADKGLKESGAGVCDKSGIDGSTYLNGIVNGRKLGQFNPISSQIVNLIFYNDSAHTSMSICTGSLLPGNVVLTAAHCIAQSASDMHVLFTNNVYCAIGRGSDGSLAYDPEVSREVTAIRVHPEYAGTESRPDPDHDLGMLHFAGTLPFGFKTFDFPTGVDVQAGDKLIMSGYGVTNEANDDGGVLRITSLPGNRLYHDDQDKLVMVVDQHDTGVCSGDSGSPLMVYKSDKLQIVGVTSSVFNPQAKSSDEICNYGSIFVDVSQQQTWLKSTYDTLKDKK